MARNIEIKARVADPGALAARAASLATQGPVEIAQDDTFFHCDAGRLKLRTFADCSGELIFYRRADQSGPKESFYLRSPTASAETLRQALALAYGVAGRVIKRRTLFLVGRTRVHLDRVVGLGNFLELEVVLDDGEAPERGVEEAYELMTSLGVEATELIKDAYVDMLGREFTSRGEKSD